MTYKAKFFVWPQSRMHTHEEALGGFGSCSRTAPVCENHAGNADDGGWSLYVLDLARTSQVCICTWVVEGTTRASPPSSSHSHSHTSHCVTLSGETLLNLGGVGKAVKKPSIVLKRWTEWTEVAFSQATGDQSAAVLVRIRAHVLVPGCARWPYLLRSAQPSSLLCSGSTGPIPRLSQKYRPIFPIAAKQSRRARKD